MEELIESEHGNSVYLTMHPVYGKVVRKGDVTPEEATMTKELSARFTTFTVKYYGYEDGNLFIEYAPDKGIRDSEHMLLVARSLIANISALHEAGYLHRDICEDNLAVTDYGVILYDFGSVCRVEDANLDVIDHYAEDDHEERAVILEGPALVEAIRVNDNYAVRKTIERLNRDNFLSMTEELQGLLN